MELSPLCIAPLLARSCRWGEYDAVACKHCVANVVVGIRRVVAASPAAQLVMSRFEQAPVSSEVEVAKKHVDVNLRGGRLSKLWRLRCSQCM